MRADPDPTGPAPPPPSGRRGPVLVLVARDGENPHQAGGDRHIGVLAEELAARGHPVRLMCGKDPSLPARAERDGVRNRPDRLAPMARPEHLGQAPGGCGTALRVRRRGDDRWGPDPVPGAALHPDTGQSGSGTRTTPRSSRAQYGAFGARLAGAVQRVVLAVHRHCVVICPSRASRAWLVSQGYDPSKVAVYYPSVDPFGLADPSRGFAERRNLVVAIGNLRPFKRFEEAIDVLGRVRLRVPDAQLAIVGRRDDSAYLRRLVERAKGSDVRGSVSFHLDVPDAEKFRLLGEAKVLTVHSPIEGFGMTIAEAGLCGVPSTVNPGVSEEVVEAGVGGVRDLRRGRRGVRPGDGGVAERRGRVGAPVRGGPTGRRALREAEDRPGARARARGPCEGKRLPIGAESDDGVGGSLLSPND